MQDKEAPGRGLTGPKLSSQRGQVTLSWKTQRAFGWWWESHGFFEGNVECFSSAEAGTDPAATKLKGQRGKNYPDQEKSWKKLSSLLGSPLTARGISIYPINLLHFGGSGTQS